MKNLLLLILLVGCINNVEEKEERKVSMSVEGSIDYGYLYQAWKSPDSKYVDVYYLDNMFVNAQRRSRYNLVNDTAYIAVANTFVDTNINNVMLLDTVNVTITKLTPDTLIYDGNVWTVFKGVVK